MSMEKGILENFMQSKQKKEEEIEILDESKSEKSIEILQETKHKEKTKNKITCEKNKNSFEIDQQTSNLKENLTNDNVLLVLTIFKDLFDES